MLCLFSCERLTARKRGLHLNHLKCFADECVVVLVGAVGSMCVDKSNMLLDNWVVTLFPGCEMRLHSLALLVLPHFFGGIVNLQERIRLMGDGGLQVGME